MAQNKTESSTNSPQLESDNGYFFSGSFWTLDIQSHDSATEEEVSLSQISTVPKPLKLPQGIPNDINIVTTTQDYLVVAQSARSEYWIIVPKSLYEQRNQALPTPNYYCEHRKSPSLGYLSVVEANSMGVFALSGHGEVTQIGKPPARNSAGDFLEDERSLLLFSKPKTLPVLERWRVKQLSAGKGFIIALAVSGLVFAWGDNKFGQLGIGHKAVGKLIRQPTELDFLNKCRVECVSAGDSHAGAVGTTKCRLHLDTAMDRGKPERVVFTWGLGENGRLGHGDLFTSSGPSAEATPLKSEPDYATLATDHDTEPGEEGSNAIPRNICPTPKCVQSLRMEKREVVKLAMGGAHSLGLLQQSTVVAWGQGMYGQLGTQHVEDEHTPVDIPNLGLVENLYAGLRNSFAVTSQGFVFAWGYNYHGEFGVGDNDIRLLPEPIVSLLHTKATSADCSCSKFALFAAKAVSSFETNASLEFCQDWCHKRVRLSTDRMSVIRHDIAQTPIDQIDDKINSILEERFSSVPSSREHNQVPGSDNEQFNLPKQDHVSAEDLQAEFDDSDDDDPQGDGLKLFTKYLFALAGPLVGKGQYRWNVKVESLNSETQYLGIGVASPDDINPYVAATPFLGDCFLYLQSQEKYANATTSDYGEFFIEGDEIGVILDLEIGTLEFSRRGKKLGIAFDNLPQNKPLCLCIALAATGDIVSILPPKQTTTDIVDESIKHCFNDIGVEKSTGMEVFYNCGPCKRRICRACARKCHQGHQRSLLINYNATRELCQCSRFNCMTKSGE